MRTNRQIIAKDAISSTSLNTGGLLNPEQANKFIDMMTDKSAFLKDIRTERMDSPTKDLDFMGVSKRIVRRGVEMQDPNYTAGIKTSKKQLNTTEIILPFDVTMQANEDSIERQQFEEHVANLMASQFSNDLTDLAINGNKAISSGNPDYDFISIDDGLLTIADKSLSTHKFDTNGSVDYKGVVFPKMLEQLPNQFKNNKNELRYYVSPSVAEAYIDQLSTRQTALGDELIQTGNLVKYKGILIYPVDYFPEDMFILTNRQNIAFGIQRQMTNHKEYKPRRRLTEYTFTARIDASEIVVDDALVLGLNAI